MCTWVARLCKHVLFTRYQISYALLVNSYNSLSLWPFRTTSLWSGMTDQISIHRDIWTPTWIVLMAFGIDLRLFWGIWRIDNWYLKGTQIRWVCTSKVFYHWFGVDEFPKWWAKLQIKLISSFVNSIGQLIPLTILNLNMILIFMYLKFRTYTRKILP